MEHGTIPAKHGPMITDLNPGPARIPPESNTAIVAWMGGHGWKVAPARWETDPETGFHVWEEEQATGGRTHALWIEDAMVRNLSAEQLVEVLNHEGLADELQFSFKVRIQERGDGYRVAIVPRRSGEWRRSE
jgi:hypothetical protein